MVTPLLPMAASYVGSTLTHNASSLTLDLVRREILSLQESLKGLSNRVTSVKADCAKAEADNETLQAYIDGVTKSLAAKTGGGA